MTKFAAISLAAVVGLAGTFGGIRMTNAASRSKISSETKYAEAENIAETTSERSQALIRPHGVLSRIVQALRKPRMLRVLRWLFRTRSAGTRMFPMQP